MEADQHKINPLESCPPPITVKQMRSFIGAYKALNKCIPHYSDRLGPLEDSVAGKDSKHHVVWNDDLQEAFKDSQQHLKSRKILTIPVPNDQLVIASDGSKSPIAVGATLYVQRGGKLLAGGFFGAKLSKSQLLWFLCEIEALGIKLTLNYFALYTKESRHTATFLTDSQPCLQAFQKLGRGEFSLSSRLSSFLVCLNSLNIFLHHISGAENILPDYVCRNPSHCPEKNCQVCKFIEESVDYAINSLSVEDIQNGKMQMPFTSLPAWKNAHKTDQELKRVYSELAAGSRPGRKEKNLKHIRRYLQIVTISPSGILVVRKPNPYRADDELIVVPQSLTSELIAALHLKLNHSTKSQLKKIWDRYFFSLNADKVIADCTTSCHLCNSLKRLPNELFEQFSSSVPQTVGLV